MDFFQPSRTQVSSTPANQHQYVYPSQTSVSSNSAPMYYQQQISHQPQQTPYQQQHYTMQTGSANTSLDYTSQHNQSGMSVHNQSGGNTRGRSGPRGGNGQSSEIGSTTPGSRFNPTPTTASQELPLRIVIDSKHVGAIIGTGGNNIREITKESKARVVVDVQRTVKDQQGHSEKIISIIGPLENCTKACIKIMDVVQREFDKNEPKEGAGAEEVELKIRAHNQLVGRLIGKQGATIKKIMQETGTTIFVSNSSEAASRAAEMNTMGSMMPTFPDIIMQMERTITVKGPSIENVSMAEQKISAKLRQSYDTDVQNRMSMPAIPGPGFAPPMADPYSYMAASMRPIHAGAGSQSTKVTKMWVPNSMVGAIIGSKGTNIRNIMRNSGANIRIEGGDKREREDEERKDDVAAPSPPEIDDGGHGDGLKLEDKKPEDERLVTITGTDTQQYKAQYCIFQRVSEQSQHYFEEVKLRTELSVPSRLVGRIIGKGGQNVRELQRITGASVKIPEDEPKSDGSVNEGKEETSSNHGQSGEGTVVRIVGNFQATQSVQLRIGTLINEFNRTSLQDRRRDEGHESSPRKQSPPTNGAE